MFGVESLEKSSSSVVYDCGGLGFFVGRVIKVSELLKNSRVYGETRSHECDIFAQGRQNDPLKNPPDIRVGIENPQSRMYPTTSSQESE